MLAAAPQGYLAIVLHAHLPFVRHPEYPIFFEEDWFFQALAESYLPLLATFEALHRDAIPFRLTISLSPTLLAMLDDELLRQRFEGYLQQIEQLLEHEERRAQYASQQVSSLIAYHKRLLKRNQRLWKRWKGNLIDAFRFYQQQGSLELITTAATHAYLPLFRTEPQAAWAQLQIGLAAFQRAIGTVPTGIWLPECGYYPGLDRILATLGIRYFLVETTSLLRGEPHPARGVYAPVFAPESGVAVFARDPEASHQVWSRESGYPSHADYREYHWDLASDLSVKLPTGLISDAGVRRKTGIKYFSVTGDEEKRFYDPLQGLRRAQHHAEHFIASRLKQLEQAPAFPPMSPPIFVAPYDAELLGHWWHEGPRWLEFVFRHLDDLRKQRTQNSPALEAITLSEYLTRFDTHQLVAPAEGSWGEGGYHAYWLNEATHWLYPQLHQATRRMVSLADRFSSESTLKPLTRRAIEQATRELLLAQASDWPFILKSQTVVEYAQKRIHSHLKRFHAISHQIEQHHIDEHWLSLVESLDTVFPNVEFSAFSSKHKSG